MRAEVFANEQINILTPTSCQRLHRSHIDTKALLNPRAQQRTKRSFGQCAALLPRERFPTAVNHRPIEERRLLVTSKKRLKGANK